MTESLPPDSSRQQACERGVAIARLFVMSILFRTKIIVAR
jgi:hypothetical protein